MAQVGENLFQSVFSTELKLSSIEMRFLTYFVNLLVLGRKNENYQKLFLFSEIKIMRMRLYHINVYYECSYIFKTIEKECSAENCNIEHTVQHEENFVIQGRRTVDINFFTEKIQALNNHSNFECTFPDMYLISEDKSSFKRFFKFKCKMCNIEQILWTEDISGNRNINTDAMTGIMSIGCGYSNVEELFSILKILSMCNNTFI